MKKAEVVELKAIERKYATIYIEGDSDLVLNKMDDVKVSPSSLSMGRLRERCADLRFAY